MHKTFWLDCMKQTDHLGDPDIHGKIVLKWILKKEGVRMWTGIIWLMIRPAASCCEHSNEVSDFIQSREFLTS